MKLKFYLSEIIITYNEINGISNCKICISKQNIFTKNRKLMNFNGQLPFSKKSCIDSRLHLKKK